MNEGDFHFVQFEDDAICAIDLLGNNIALNHDTSKQTVPGFIAHVHWQEEEMTPLLVGVRQVTALAFPEDDDKKGSKTKKPKTEESKKTSSSSSNPPWSLSVDGTISARMEGSGSEDEKQWMEASVDAPCFVLPDRPDCLPTRVSVQGATFGPTSFGDISIHMSSMSLSTNSVRESVLDDIYKFAFRVLGISSDE